MEIKNRQKFLKWFRIIVFGPFLLLLFVLLLVGIFADIPSFSELEDPKSNLATEIISEEGEILTTFHIENRSYILSSLDLMGMNLSINLFTKTR